MLGDLLKELGICFADGAAEEEPDVVAVDGGETEVVLAVEDGGGLFVDLLVGAQELEARGNDFAVGLHVVNAGGAVACAIGTLGCEVDGGEEQEARGRSCF